MATLRTPFQGVLNIIRFNWHFYAAAITLVVAVAMAHSLAPGPLTAAAAVATLAAVIGVIVSLAVSHYIYDRSGLYSLAWLADIDVPANAKILNINAGFDEISNILKARYPDSILSVFDFYDPVKHTEVSIKRARRVYPPYPGTIPITTGHIPLLDDSIDLAFLMLAAHEIRDASERVSLFRELRRVVRSNGRVVVTEHLRDLPNGLAYNIGFFHFLPRNSWYRVFRESNFVVERTVKITPFITTFILRKDGAAS